MFTWEREFALLDFFHDLFLIWTIKGRLSTQHHVQNDSNAPNVTKLVVVSFKHFRSNIVSCTLKHMHFFICWEHLRGAEVNQLEFILIGRILGVNKHVFRLEITVADIFSMAVSDRWKQLLKNLGGILLCKFAPEDDLVKKFPALA